MAVPVAAIVKKVAIAILGADKETKSKIGVAIGTAIVAPFVPVMLFVGLFASVDSDSVRTNFWNRIDTNISSYIAVVDTNLDSIQSSMSAAGFNEVEIRVASDIYTIYFITSGCQDNFVSRYVACFSSGQTATQLASNLNSTFGTSVDASRIQSIMNALSSTYIDSSRFQDVYTKNNLDICEWAQMAYDQHWGYVWGTYGRVLTASSLKSLSQTYPTQVGAAHFHDYIVAHYMNIRTVDCVGLIKSYMWYDFNSDSFHYGSHGFTDDNTEATFSNAPVKGPISTMPDIPGLGVYHKGHVGIYIGNGIVIEAMGTRYGMQRRALTAGSWTHWFYIPGLTYINPEEETTETTTEITEETEPTEVIEPTETTNTTEENTDG